MDHLVLTTEADWQRLTDRLVLDDLHVGQRFTSMSHVVDTDQIADSNDAVRSYRTEGVHLF